MKGVQQIWYCEYSTSLMVKKSAHRGPSIMSLLSAVLLLTTMFDWQTSMPFENSALKPFSPRMRLRLESLTSPVTHPHSRQMMLRMQHKFFSRYSSRKFKWQLDHVMQRLLQSKWLVTYEYAALSLAAPLTFCWCKQVKIVLPMH